MSASNPERTLPHQRSVLFNSRTLSISRRRHPKDAKVDLSLIYFAMMWAYIALVPAINYSVLLVGLRLLMGPFALNRLTLL